MLEPQKELEILKEKRARLAELQMERGRYIFTLPYVEPSLLSREDIVAVARVIVEDEGYDTLEMGEEEIRDRAHEILAAEREEFLRDARPAGWPPV